MYLGSFRNNLMKILQKVVANSPSVHVFICLLMYLSLFTYYSLQILHFEKCMLCLNHVSELILKYTCDINIKTHI